MNVDIIKSGYLKQKSSYLKQIRKRWVVLEGHKIYCYKHDKDHLIQIVNLDIYSILEFNNINPLEFELKTKGKKQQIHQFVARSAEDRQQWIRHIQDVRNRYQHQLMNKKSPTYNEESDSENNLLRDHNEEQYLAEFRVAEWKTFYVNYQMHDKFITKLNCKIKRFKQMKLRRSKLKALKIDAELIQNMLAQEIDLVDGFFCSQLQLCQLMRDHHEKFQKVTYEANTSAHSTILAELLKLTINLKTYVFQNYVALSNLINRIEPMISFICNVKQQKFKIMNNVKHLLKTLHNMHILKSHSLVKEMRNKSLKDYTFVKKQTKKEIEPEVTPLIKEIENADVDYWSEEYKDEGSFGHNVTIESSGSNYVLDIDSKQKSTDTNTTMSNTAKTFTISSAWPSTNEGMNYYSTAHIKPRRYYGCNVIPENKQKCYLASCRCLHSLIEIMNGYKQCINGKYKQIFDDNMNVNNVLNSFLHLMQMHSHTDEEFEMISNLFGKCNINNCNIFKRRGNPKLQNDNPQHACRYQILDKIHCYYYHCYDVGNRLLTKDKLLIHNSRNTATDNEFLQNEILKKMHNTLTKKRKSFKDVYMNATSNYAKFNQLSTCTQQNMYVFGCDFRYNGTGEHSEQKNEYKTQQKYLIITPIYSSLKEELTTNSLTDAVITMSQFKVEYGKGEIHFNTECRKRNYPKITMNHILCLMLYCNFDTLQAVFSATYRDKCGNNHKYFYHMGKYIKEAVHEFGTRIQDGTIKIFYHGINQKMIFPQIIGKNGNGVKIFCPLSTSSSIVVAANFTNNNNGLIVEFLNDWSKLKYFCVSWLSDFAAESEHLFIQNQYELQIQNIHDVKYGLEFNVIIDCLHLIDEIMSEEYLEKPIHKKMKLLTVKLIHHQLSQYGLFEYKSFKSLHEYAQRLMDVYFNNKMFLKINYASIQMKYSFIESKLIQIGLLNALYPNIQEIEIKDINLNHSLMDKIVYHLVRNEIASKLQIIRIKAIRKSEKNVSEIIIEYKEYFQQMGFIMSKGEKRNALRIERQ